MTPPTASFTSGPQTSTLDPIHNIKKNLNSSTTNNDATLAPYKTYVPIKAGQEPVENYEGQYRFADIKEHHTSRAMTRRYYEDMMASAQSDVIVIGGELDFYFIRSPWRFHFSSLFKSRIKNRQETLSLI